MLLGIFQDDFMKDTRGKTPGGSVFIVFTH